MAKPAKSVKLTKKNLYRVPRYVGQISHRETRELVSGLHARLWHMATTPSSRSTRYLGVLDRFPTGSRAADWRLFVKHIKQKLGANNPLVKLASIAASRFVPRHSKETAMTKPFNPLFAEPSVEDKLAEIAKASKSREVAEAPTTVYIGVFGAKRKIMVSLDGKTVAPMPKGQMI